MPISAPCNGNEAALTPNKPKKKERATAPQDAQPMPNMESAMANIFLFLLYFKINLPRSI